MTNEAPKFERVRALDVKPYRWALWCAIEGGEPFANTIVGRQWADDGQSLWFLLDSHNAYRVKADATVELVPYEHVFSEDFLARIDARDREEMAKRPCLTCGRKGKA